MGPKIEWNDEWIAENYLRYPSYKKMAEDYNKRFGTTVSSSAIKNHSHYKLGIEKPSSRRETYYTQEQIDWLTENYPKYGCRKTVEMFNKKFKQNRTISSMKNFGYTHKAHVEGKIATKNKLEYGARSDTSKRAKRQTGDIREECGRLVMKTDDGKWKSVGRAVYEKEYGKIPKGYVVIHLNKDNSDYSLENLIAVPLSYLGLLSRYGLHSESRKVTEVGITWCELYTLLKDEIVKDDVAF